MRELLTTLTILATLAISACDECVVTDEPAAVLELDDGEPLPDLPTEEPPPRAAPAAEPDHGCCWCEGGEQICDLTATTSAVDCFALAQALGSCTAWLDCKVESGEVVCPEICGI